MVHALSSDATHSMVAAANDCSLAATIAPEDLRVGEYVTILNESHEFPSFFWCRDFEFRAPGEPVCVQLRAAEGGKPYRVRAICLPFVLLKTPKGKYETVDIRGVQLVRLNHEYAKRTWSVLRKKKKMGFLS